MLLPILFLPTLLLLLLPLALVTPDYALTTAYLSKYGYLTHSHSTHSSSLQRLDTAITRLQAFAGLEQTGEIDRETEQVIQMRRCGVKDIQKDDQVSLRRLTQFSGSSRRKRYALQGSRWKTKTLTYKISKYSSKRGLSRTDADLTIKKALTVWSDKTNLRFVKRSIGNVHIDVRFERKAHGDEDDFDGKEGTLAHAFFPIYGGDVHFDVDEDWTVDSFRGTSLLMSASHELGHSLGLAHSNVRGSLMSPFYSGYRSDLSLHTDDVDGIQALYGKKDTFQNRNIAEDINTRSILQPVASPPPSTPTSFICRGYLDTMVTTSTGVTYAFLGGKYWKLSDTSVEPGYPRLISQGWPGLRFTDAGQIDEGYPKEISEGFEGIPDNVDAAFVWPVNKKIYFFKGSEYWKFDPEKSPPVGNSYPRPINNWDGVPNNLDSAMQYNNGKTYFFKMGKYYRFDDNALTVDTSADPPYPRDTSYWWFGCK